MKVAIVGCRDFGAHNTQMRERVWLLVRQLRRRDPSTIIVSGGARGVDSWAEEAARHFGLGVEVYKADWDRYGRGAGHRRNTTIVEVSDAVVAFWDGKKLRIVLPR